MISAPRSHACYNLSHGLNINMTNIREVILPSGKFFFLCFPPAPVRKMGHKDIDLLVKYICACHEENSGKRTFQLSLYFSPYC